MINIQKIGKKFGALPVLHDVSFKIEKGECYCLIGKNGAGKSTLINILIDLLSADKGSMELFGTSYDEDPIQIKRKIGVLPEFNPVIEEFSGYDYLKYVGLIYDLQRDVLDKRIDLLANYFFEDTHQLEKQIAFFSKGMKIKIGICAASIHKPEFLILDEPFENLDPLARTTLVSFLNNYRKMGNAVLVSSHEMICIEKIATHVGILDNQTLIFSGSMDRILKESMGNFDEHIVNLLGYKSKSLIDF